MLLVSLWSLFSLVACDCFGMHSPCGVDAVWLQPPTQQFTQKLSPIADSRLGLGRHMLRL